MGIFQQDQARALSRAGHRIGILAPAPRSLRLLKKRFLGWPSGVEIGKEEKVSVYKHHTWCWFPRTYRSCRQFLRIGLELYHRYVETEGVPDVIHAHNVLFAGVLANEIKHRYGIDYIVTEHSSSFARHLIPPWADTLISKAYREACQLVVVSPKLGSLLADRYGIEQGRFVWVPNVLDRHFSSNCSDVTPDDSFVFLNVASLDENKGHRYLLDAFAQSFKGNPQVTLRIAGDGPLENFLKIYCSELGIASQVTFLGRISRGDVLKEMASCHTFVLSSLYETFGVVLVESLACGKPVVATACGGPECIVNDGNGILVPPQSVESLAAGMETVKNMYATFEQQTIRKQCLDRYGEDAFVAQIVPLLQSALQRRLQ